MASVTLRQIKKSYGDTHIIKGVDLKIGDGEFLVLVGPSGCGKSTLLRLIAGLEEISGGELLIGERVVNDVSPRDRGLGMVFQSYALYPHMTVRENMAFGLKIRKLDPKLIDERVTEASRQLSLDKLLDRHPKDLSGGQQQRVAIGRAIVRQPEVFLFDEPLSNLDAALRTQMRIELKKLHRRLESTMIYVTHDQVEAMTLADRIAIVKDGHLQQVGTPDEVYNRPVNQFVAGFIGSPAMNFLQGQRVGQLFEAEDMRIPLPEGVQAHVVGVRPQHLTLLREDAPESHGRLEATVDVIEPMGWEAHVHVHVGKQSVIAHAQTEQLRDVRPGDLIKLGVDPTRLHLFDARGDRVEPS